MEVTDTVRKLLSLVEECALLLPCSPDARLWDNMGSYVQEDNRTGNILIVAPHPRLRLNTLLNNPEMRDQFRELLQRKTHLRLRLCNLNSADLIRLREVMPDTIAVVDLSCNPRLNQNDFIEFSKSCSHVSYINGQFCGASTNSPANARNVLVVLPSISDKWQHDKISIIIYGGKADTAGEGAANMATAMRMRGYAHSEGFMDLPSLEFPFHVANAESIANLRRAIQNYRGGEHTFFMFYYAGHGAILFPKLLDWIIRV